MARIVYGISGEGSGHSSRARVVLSHLRSRGHQVRAVSYDRGYRNLRDEFEVFETEGLSIATTDNSVAVGKTIADNLAKLVSGHQKARRLKREFFEDFRPHCVITDFEPMTAYLAHHFELPLITIDNQHRMRYMHHPCPRRLQGSAGLTQTVIRAMIPRPDVSLVTTFYFGEVRNRRTFLFPPILRAEVLEAVPVTGAHVLVYLTQGFESLLAGLHRFPREHFVVYGAGRAGEDANVSYQAPSAGGFLRDLASCKAVMATAGFTLMTEALHLRKPYLAFPMRGQFEQELNGLLLADLGYGKNCRRFGAEAVGDFLYRLPEFRERMESYPGSENREILQKVDQLLAGEGALAREFHRRRRSGES